ncbi:Rpn family recombination-promoting nuclease/putative transposase [Paenibacillus antri]|uniref:Rpn family recombination-promoting nuclease/putative transposase n=2 Tax=Paenibacillus antri TaxID=2582848 RepID=A0A5R9GG25_9BACL|nr:Rpn family recombination-promoting nuclease/putative transposase [Paenibacillus antri]
MAKDMSNPLHRWLLYLTENMPEHERRELIERDPDLKKTEELLLRLSGDEETYRLYEAREHSLMERNSLIADGVAKGLEEGMEKGMEKGVEQGKIDVAKNMLEKGFELALIAELTGMDIEQVRGISKTNT